MSVVGFVTYCMSTGDPVAESDSDDDAAYFEEAVGKRPEAGNSILLTAICFPSSSCNWAQCNIFASRQNWA